MKFEGCCPTSVRRALLSVCISGTAELVSKINVL